MDNASLQKIKDIIARSQSVVVAVSENPTVDQMAGALSLYLNLASANKKTIVLSPTEPIVELSSLVGIDKVKTSNDGSGGDLVVSFPYREGEIEKVSYTIDDGFLNIVVKAGEQGLTFQEQDVIFKRGSGKADLVFTIGISDIANVAGILPEESIKDATIINIDNSTTNTSYGDVVLVSNKFSSLSEQVADLLLNLGMDMDVDVAQNLLSGVMQATGNFQDPQTSYLAFEIAAILMKRGAVRGQATYQPSRETIRPQREPMQVRENVTARPSLQPQQQLQAQPQSQPQPQTQQQPRDDRREAIRDALRQRSQMRGNAPKQDQSRGQQIQQSRSESSQSEQKPPSDWLTPKVYKGSSNI